MSQKKARLSSWVNLGLYINTAIENGKDVSFDDLYSCIKQGTLLEDLNTKFPDQFDFSLFLDKDGDPEQYIAIKDVLNDVAGAWEARENRKLGVKNSGLHLLLACILDAILRKEWEEYPHA